MAPPADLPVPPRVRRWRPPAPGERPPGRLPVSAVPAAGGESPRRAAWRRLRGDRAARLSLAFLAAFGATSLLAPLLPLRSPVAMDLPDEPQPPVWPWQAFGEHGFEPVYWDLGGFDAALVRARAALFGDWQTGRWLGTDAKGRDLFARIVWGSRTSILVALAAAATSLLIGVTYGAFAGLSGGRTDRVMMRLVDVLFSLPFIFVVIFLIAMLAAPRPPGAEPPPSRETVLFAVIGAVYWLTMARVVRGQVLSLKNAEFVAAARALGASTPRILFAHVVPNVLPVVVVYLTLTVPAVILFEAFLSFLGLGIQPPKVSWGLLAVEGADAINPLRIYWWLVLFPTAAMAGVLLALNLVGDGLRDALDPRERGAL